MMHLAAHLPKPASPQLLLSSNELEAPKAVDDKPRADRALDRQGYTLAGAGALFVPSSFHSADGAFDLLVHFNGNAELVAESVAAAGLDALVLVVNLGVGSGVYEARYSVPAMLDYDLERVVAVARARGLENPHLRRLAFSAWSAGYGALVRLLVSEEVFRRATAVLLCDAMHAGFSDKRSRAVDMDRIDPFVRFAREASLGKKLFVMTHSEVGEFRYATTTETSDALLAALGIFRARKTDWPERPTLPLSRAVMTTESWLEQRSEARRGELHVAGYKGFREDDHIAHLAQMSTTVLPELVSYWSRLRD